MRARWAWAAAAGAAAALIAGVWALYDSLFPIFLGFGLAYALDPAADRLESRGLSRVQAVLLIMAGAAGALLLFTLLIVPSLLSDIQDLAREFPRHFEAVLARALSWAQALGLKVPSGREELLLRLRRGLEAAPLAALSPLGAFLGRFFSGAAESLVAVLNLLVMPLVFFYFLRDISKIRQAVLRQVPPRHRRLAEARLDEADRVFSGYLRGQTLVALILAVLYAAGLSLVGVNFGLVIGVISGLLNVVPYVGVATGLTLSLTMALVQFGGWGEVLGILVVFGGAQLLEGFVITPRMVGDRVGLNTVETILALIVGGQLAGLTGLVLAIPVAGCLKVYVRDALAAYRRSSLYTGA